MEVFRPGNRIDINVLWLKFIKEIDVFFYFLFSNNPKFYEVFKNHRAKKS